MGIKLISSLFSFCLTILFFIGLAYCIIKLCFKKKNANANKNRTNSNPNNNIIHVNYPNSDTPFYVDNNNEVVPLPGQASTNTQATNINEIRPTIGWNVDRVPMTNSDMNQPPPPYSVAIQNTAQ